MSLEAYLHLRHRDESFGNPGPNRRVQLEELQRGQIHCHVPFQPLQQRVHERFRTYRGSAGDQQTIDLAANPLTS